MGARVAAAAVPAALRREDAAGAVWKCPKGNRDFEIHSDQIAGFLVAVPHHGHHSQVMETQCTTKQTAGYNAAVYCWNISMSGFDQRAVRCVK